MYKVNFASDLITDLFLKFNNSEIQYCVLRNYSSLPKKNSSKDVDILINHGCLNQALNDLYEVAELNNYQLIWYNNLDYLVGFAFVKLVGDEVFSAKIDLFNGLKWHGCTYINQSYIFEKTELYNGFKVPNKGHEAFIMIVYYLLYAKNIKQKYHLEIYNNIENNSIAFEEIIFKTFSRKTARRIVHFTERKDINSIIQLRKTIKNKICLEAVFLILQ